ncbi:MAG: pyridoxamine 5'-phosphate oxidase [Gammaproteobacteria bacterium]|nr:pyridoxamine 5'-phosphate oxidase [Gammaproteobacteria bacterium]
MSDQSISDLRKDYQKDSLTRAELLSDPMQQFQSWLDTAIKAKVLEPTAMNLATSSAEGVISSRMVLLKDLDARGFSFFTNYESRKASDLAEHGRAALCFWWGALERQVRIEGVIEKVSAQDSDDYYSRRPRGSRIGAIASRQSTELSSHAELEQQVKEVEKQYAQGAEIQRPEYWGGYRLLPESLEFWQGRPSRLHDRFCYQKSEDGQWQVRRLAP